MNSENGTHDMHVRARRVLGGLAAAVCWAAQHESRRTWWAPWEAEDCLLFRSHSQDRVGDCWKLKQCQERLRRVEQRESVGSSIA